MISIELYLIIVVLMILLYLLGLFAVRKMNVLGFVASGISALTMILLTLLSGFGRVGNTISVSLYNETNTTGVTTIESATMYIHPSLVYISGFISVMMVIILLFVIGRYIAMISVINKGEEEE